MPLLLAVVVTAVIGLHRFSPDNWPSLAVDIIHSLHGSGFAVLALIIYWFLRRRFPSRVNYLLAAVITMAIGLVSEAAQIPGPRDAQFSDLLIDGLGIFGALGFLAAFDPSVRRQLRKSTRVLLPALAGTALAIAGIPSLWLSYALVQQYRAFPTLLTFEHNWERAIYKQPEHRRPLLIAVPTGWPVTNGTIARSSEAGRWGIFLSLKPVQNWSAFRSLSFIAASPGRPFVFDVAIKDVRQKKVEKEQARFYKKFQVGPEPKRYTISFAEIESEASNGPFDFTLVESVVLSAADPGTGVEILLDDFRLEQ